MSPPPTDPRAQMAPARLLEVQRVNGQTGLAVFTLQPESGELPEFTAGQHTTLCWEHEGQPVVRYYNIASAPEQRGRWEFYVVRVDKPGVATPELFALPVGSRLWLGTPSGRFTLERTRKRHLALVATGTGLAPYISMLRHLRRAPQSVDAVSLWHGVRHPSDLGYRDELEQLARSAPFRMAYVPTASRATAAERKHDPALSFGRVDTLLCRVLGLPLPDDPRGAHLAPAHDRERLRAQLPEGDTATFLCGNPNMIRSFAACAEGSPYHADLVYEKYW
ncbi:MAG: hypothetical protein EYC70_00275 [Planctomycetota bacterium]|nr:MAG: hypothetical protein EYC70_00275 [Planctomycetota bacterium]